MIPHKMLIEHIQEFQPDPRHPEAFLIIPYRDRASQYRTVILHVYDAEFLEDGDTRDTLEGAIAHAQDRLTVRYGTLSELYDEPGLRELQQSVMCI